MELAKAPLAAIRRAIRQQMERPTEVDHRADIYALGVTLYELLTGELRVVVNRMRRRFGEILRNRKFVLTEADDYRGVSNPEMEQLVSIDDRHNVSHEI